MSYSGKTKKIDLEKLTNKPFWALEDLEKEWRGYTLEQKKEILWILRNLQNLNR